MGLRELQKENYRIREESIDKKIKEIQERCDSCRYDCERRGGNFLIDSRSFDEVIEKYPCERKY